MKSTLSLLLLFASICSLAQTHYGSQAGTAGASHSYFGSYAGNAALSSSYENSFFGASSGRSTTTGFGNTAAGVSSLRYNSSGYWNTALGNSTLHLNTEGHRNTAVGRMSLYSNTIGSYNVAIGYHALFENSDGQKNVAVGSFSLSKNPNGFNNVAVGHESMFSNTGGSNNTVAGNQALYLLATGSNNVAIGFEALKLNTDGSNNTAVGNGAMRGMDIGDYNTASGSGALSRRIGSYNTAFGASAFNALDVTGDCAGTYISAFGYNSGANSLSSCSLINSMALGAWSRVTASNQIRLGDANVTSIGGQVAWTTLSDGRFKKEIKQDVAGLEFINALSPVSYIVDRVAVSKFLGVPDSVKSIDSTPQRQVGFIAQEVEAIIKKGSYTFSGVESPQNEEDTYSIRYAEFVVPLVKAVQELSSQVEDLRSQLIRYTGETAAKKQAVNLSAAFLYQNIPNPSSAGTEIQMDLPDTYHQAHLIIYNLEGKQIKTFDVTQRGKTAVRISAGELHAGMYLYTLMADGQLIDTKRMILTE